MMRHARHARQAHGFTLIEVVVALALVALALAAGAQASGALTRSAERLGDLLLARLCAENELTKARLSMRMPGIGESSSVCEQAGRSYTVQVQVRPTPNPNFLRIDARVSGAEDGPGAILSIATVQGRY